jgi:hypothetical protein
MTTNRSPLAIVSNSEVTSPQLSVLETNRVLRIARGGRLMPWLGPALRGLAGGRLRARECRQPVGEQLGRWERCTGCLLMSGCAYGETLEPDPPVGTHLASGWENTSRPLVVAPAYPAPEIGRIGDQIPVRVVFIGSVAAAHSEGFWDALSIGGADPMLGLGEDRVLFDILPSDGLTNATKTEEVTLSTDPANVPGVVPWVRVIFTSPLVVNTSGDRGKKRLIERPTLADLLRAGLRVLGPLFRCYGSALPEPVFAKMKELSVGVPTLETRFGVVGQIKSSHRTGDRYSVRGVVGYGLYGPVPVGLLPWLRWAGRLHVGTHRVAGAGGWRVEGPKELSTGET